MDGKIPQGFATFLLRSDLQQIINLKISINGFYDQEFAHRTITQLPAKSNRERVKSNFLLTF